MALCSGEVCLSSIFYNKIYTGRPGILIAMRVVEPKELENRRAERLKQRKKRTNYSALLIVLVLALVAGLGYLVTKRLDLTLPQINQHTNKVPEAVITPEDKPKTKLKKFTGEQFKQLYRSVHYPNVQTFTIPPQITGNTIADLRIRKLAEARGFALTSIPIAPISKTHEKMLAGEDDDLLQPLALKSWEELKAAAKKDNVPITLISAYRSPKWQRDFFMGRLLNTGVSVEQIAAGMGDEQVKTTLGLTAVPGYSRHHTGYTVDMYCEDDLAFANSVCFKWLNANNYEHAKQFGWIPSYPEDAKEQGPEPEPWEYVWVGTDSLYE